MLKSRRRPLLRAAVATAALSAPLPASALSGPAGSPRTWTGEAAPFSDANLVDVVNMGRGRTWAAGFTVRNEGRITRFQPVVAERAEPGGAWTPPVPGAPGTGAAQGRWKNLGLSQPAATDASVPVENSASGVVGGRAGLTVVGTPTAAGAMPQPFLSVRNGRR